MMKWDWAWRSWWRGTRSLVRMEWRRRVRPWISVRAWEKVRPRRVVVGRWVRRRVKRGLAGVGGVKRVGEGGLRRGRMARL